MKRSLKVTIEIGIADPFSNGDRDRDRDLKFHEDRDRDRGRDRDRDRNFCDRTNALVIASMIKISNFFHICLK